MPGELGAAFSFHSLQPEPAKTGPPQPLWAPWRQARALR